MGVDASNITAYGVFWSKRIYEGESQNHEKLFFWEDDELQYDWWTADDRNLEIRIEPYSCDWTFIGVNFLADTPEDTIENLKHVKEKWEQLHKELLEAIPDSEEILKKEARELKPSIVSEAYFS